MDIYILGISCFYHDSAIALLKNGELIFAIQEERLSRKKYDSSFPEKGIVQCLNSQNLDLNDIDYIVYYEKPLLTFERLLETYIDAAPGGFRSFITAMQVWLKEKLFIKFLIKEKIKSLQIKLGSKSKSKVPELLFSEHHKSHAGAAFFPSPFEEAVILCIDGVGEWATTSTWLGKGNNIKPFWEINFPHSLGLLYSAFTYFCGFKVNSGEYKLMGLAPYGKPIYVDLIKEKIIDIKEDGTFRLDMSYFNYHKGLEMTNNKFNKLFGQKPRKMEGPITQFYMDLAASIQNVTEEVVIRIAKSLRKETGIKNLCLAGGVALNCVVNGRLIREKIFEDIWIQPASGDSGSCIGAALLVWHEYLQHKRRINPIDSMKGTYLGTLHSNKEIIFFLKSIGASFRTLDDQKLFEEVAQNIDNGMIVGWFNGRMEFGPRALGGRSIIADPRNSGILRKINTKIKKRESFRPLAPSILEENVSNNFELEIKSPYMLFVAPIKKELRVKIGRDQEKVDGLEKVHLSRSILPAITHVDYSARIQTVNENSNPRYYELIKAFKKRTGCSSLVNTSFNIRGEPIVCTPEDALKCFMSTGLDVLVLENQILYKKDQNRIGKNYYYESNFELD